jgi:hypothetical protein
VRGELKPVAQKGLGKVVKLYEQLGKKNFYVTCIREGRHMPGSLHYCGLAFDFQSQKVLIKDVRNALGPDWDVVGHLTHFHAEYDPR